MWTGQCLEENLEHGRERFNIFLRLRDEKYAPCFVILPLHLITLFFSVC